MIVVGFDTGFTGAVSFYDADMHDLVLCRDMPVHSIEVNGKERTRVDDRELLRILAGLDGVYAFIERPEIRPLKSRNKQTGALDSRTPGAAGMFAFGEAYGNVTTSCRACGLIIQEMRPKTWIRAMGTSAIKDERRRTASDRYPRWAGNFTRKSDDGRADSALIAEWGARQIAARRIVP